MESTSYQEDQLDSPAEEDQDDISNDIKSCTDHENALDKTEMSEELADTDVTPVSDYEVEYDADKRRELFTTILTARQRIYIYFLQGPDFLLSQERGIELRQELKESIDDFMEMDEFIRNYFEQSLNNPTLASSRDTEIRKINNLRVLSWDVGMLSYQYMGTRAKAIADLILQEEFDVVFLQEVNPVVYMYLRCRLTMTGKYTHSRGREVNHGFHDFTVTCIRKDRMNVIRHKIIYFGNTRENRTLLKTEVMIGNAKVCLLNTHLESMARNTLYRSQQLQKCFNICQSMPSDYHIIFGGSFNIRDWELAKLNYPKNLEDMWKLYGNSGNQYTWDLTINKLIQMPPNPKSKGQPRTRYGRLYFRRAVPTNLEPRSFSLTGRGIVAAEKYSPSDHWGLTANFMVNQRCFESLPLLPQGPMKEARSRGIDLLEGEEEDGMGNKTKYVVKENWDDESD